MPPPREDSLCILSARLCCIPSLSTLRHVSLETSFDKSVFTQSTFASTLVNLILACSLKFSDTGGHDIKRLRWPLPWTAHRLTGDDAIFEDEKSSFSDGIIDRGDRDVM